MQKEISSKSITINSSIADDIEEVMNKNLNVSPFMKLFWEQQKSSQNKGSTVRYHPMIIRFCFRCIHLVSRKTCQIFSQQNSIYSPVCKNKSNQNYLICYFVRFQIFLDFQKHQQNLQNLNQSKINLQKGSMPNVAYNFK